MNQNIENIELLKKGLADFSIQVDDLMVDRFEKYRQVLVEYNQHMNLTGITEQREVYIKHFLDSVAIFKNGYIGDGL